MGKNVSLGELPLPEQGTQVLAPKPQAAKRQETSPSLSEDEMKSLEAEAKKELQAEIKEQLAADYKERVKAEERRKIRFVKDTAGLDNPEQVTIELPSFADRITLDGVVYLHGYSYKFGKAKAAAVREIMHRAWMHQAEIDGKDMNEFLGRKKYLSTLGPKGVAV